MKKGFVKKSSINVLTTDITTSVRFRSGHEPSAVRGVRGPDPRPVHPQGQPRPLLARGLPQGKGARQKVTHTLERKCGWKIRNLNVY